MSAEGISRPARAEVSAGAIAHNARVMKELAGEAALCAVVKANGYGHGALFAANAALEGGATWLAVAILDEGIELRAAGVGAPILLLAEIPPTTLENAFRASLTPTIGSLAGARAAVSAAREVGGLQRVHLKVDTGMHRMGVAPEEIDEVLDVLVGAAEIDLEGLYTHFSVADSSRPEDRRFTRGQLERFNELVAKLATRDVHPRVRHAANSAAVLAYPEARLSMVRVGLALYGYLPQAWLGSVLDERGLALRSALSLRAQVTAIRRVKAGEAPSYGRKRALERDSWVATVAFGYADGYPRRLFHAGAQVLIGAKRYPLAGNVTMDQLVIDLGDDEVGVGDEVVLLGRQGDQEISAEEWATLVETITWEILCGVGARVPRVLVS